MSLVRRVSGLAAVVLLLAVACTAGTPSPRRELWASHVDRWLANSQEAARAGVPNLSAFLSPDVMIDLRGSVEGRAQGRDAALALYRELLNTDQHRHLRGPAYLSTTGLVAISHSALTAPDSGQDTALLMTFSRQGLVREESALAVVSGRWRAEIWRTGALPNDWEPLEVLAEHYLAAWSGSDHGAAAKLYDPAAVVHDGLLGRRLTGRTAVERAADHGARIRLVRLPLLGGPAVFGKAAPLTDSFQKAVLLVRSDDGTGCPGQVAVVLTLGAAGTVTTEERYHRLDDARRCLTPALRPRGWWDELPVPDAVPLRRTGTVMAGDRRVEVWNGSDPLDSLLRWALARYVMAGLPVPEPASVTFYAAAPARCGGQIGLASGPELTEITLCFGADRACPRGACPPWSDEARTTVLHELAHTWLSQNLDGGARARYLDKVGLTWADPRIPWSHRGVERAAETIAWGLDAQPGTIGDVGDGTARRQLASEFRLLTGHEPLAR
jgi:hypothetical protein